MPSLPGRASISSSREVGGGLDWRDASDSAPDRIKRFPIRVRPGLPLEKEDPWLCWSSYDRAGFAKLISFVRCHAPCY